MPTLWAESLDEHRSLVMGRLLDAFAELQAERGLDQVTLAAVAGRAGLARSAIYNYVRDKHELLFAHGERVIARFVHDLTAAAGAGERPAERLRRYVQGTFDAFARHGAGADLMPLLSPAEQQRMVDLLQPVRTVIEGIVADGLADGTFAGDAQHLVGFVGAVLGGYRLAVGGGEDDGVPSPDEVTRLLLRGLSDAVA